MPLTLQERARVKTALGYGNVSAGASLSFGFARPIQTMFIVEDAMNLVTEEGVQRVRTVLGILDQIECRLVQALTLLDVVQVGEVKPNLEVCDRLEVEYVRWVNRLCDELMVPKYPFSSRFSGSPAMAAGNIRTRPS